MCKIARTIELTFDNRSEGFTLPINPKTFELSEPSLNQKATLLNIGEVNLLGNRGLITCTLSGLLPSSKSPHYKRADREPMDYIELLKKWRDSKKPIRFIVSDSNINLAMGIEKLSYTINEGDHDIYYTLELSEYRFLNVSTVKMLGAVKQNGLKDRPSTAAVPKTHLVKQGDCLWNIAQKYYGSGARYTEIYSANKGLIDERNKKYQMPQNTIYAGQELIIP